MHRALILSILLSLYCPFLFSQTVRQVLEFGKPISTASSIYINFNAETRQITYDAIDRLEAARFIPFNDSTIILAKRETVNVYLKPLNPLNYSYTAETKTVEDNLNVAAAKAIQNFILPRAREFDLPISPPISDDNCSNKIIKINENLKSILSKASTSNKQILDMYDKSEIHNLFQRLKSLDFAHENRTNQHLQAITNDKTKLEDTYKKTVALHTATLEMIKDSEMCFVDKLYNNYISIRLATIEINRLLEDFENSLKNLQNAYTLVQNEFNKAAIGGGTEQVRWLIPISGVAINSRSFSTYTISIYESNFNLSPTGDIESKGKVQLLTKSMRLRQYQRFVPEVSVGTAFTFLEYNTYGTATNSSGQVVVAEPTKNTLKNMRITTMLNFNYYIPHSFVHPFYQIGAGINSEIPSLLTGLGIRSSAAGTNGIAIAGGIALSWVRDLSSLKVGDPVTGTSQIDQDYVSSPTPKLSPYIGIQYNF